MHLRSKQQEQQLKTVNPPWQKNWTFVMYAVLESCKSHISLLHFYFKSFQDQIISFALNSFFFCKFLTFVLHSQLHIPIKQATVRI